MVLFWRLLWMDTGVMESTQAQTIDRPWIIPILRATTSQHPDVGSPLQFRPNASLGSGQVLAYVQDFRPNGILRIWAVVGGFDLLDLWGKAVVFFWKVCCGSWTQQGKTLELIYGSLPHLLEKMRAFFPLPSPNVNSPAGFSKHPSLILNARRDI